MPIVVLALPMKNGPPNTEEWLGAEAHACDPSTLGDETGRLLGSLRPVWAAEQDPVSCLFFNAMIYITRMMIRKACIL